MSHFMVAVITDVGERVGLSRPTLEIKESLDRLMAPFDEGLEVESHPEDCWCEGNPDCPECHGTGVFQGTFNEQAEWDWYRIGGRFDGLLTGIERPSTDRGFNFAASHEQLEYNALLCRDIRPDFSPYAVLTPDGEWHAGGWSYMDPSDEQAAEWNRQVRAWFDQYPNNWAVGVDCHI